MQRHLQNYPPLLPTVAGLFYLLLHKLYFTWLKSGVTN
nr:MAG TPA: hypothetical protein [Caudoviricetes sp.]